MKTLQQRYYYYLAKPEIKLLLQFFLIIALLLLANHAFAAGDTDLLEGTDTGLRNTINGTGKKFLYFAEGILSLAMYIKTKNLLVLGGIVVVAVFLNILLKVST